jgi:queuine tRNA-ribosyltransferase
MGHFQKQTKMTRKRTFLLPHGELRLPIYLPDATRGVVRSVDSADLERCGIEALVMNTFHLMQHPGSSTIKSLGGLHQMTGWEHPIITDSGGFQIYSLIRQNPKYGSLNDKGANFRTDASDRKYNLTPEKSIQLQMSYGADVLICLDDPTHVDDSFEEQRASVRRTIAWAKRSKTEFQKLLKEKKLEADQHPKIFGVIQGGGSTELRQECADALLEIGFDGFGYGGWPLDSENNLLVDMLELTRSLVPEEFPLHALGVGHPANVAASYQIGYDIFDSAMPTRDARNGRLYVWTAERIHAGSGWFSYIYPQDSKHTKADEPVSAVCDCVCCERYSLGYLHHLFEIKDTLAFRLATLHNLRFMAQLIQQLRDSTPLND